MQMHARELQRGLGGEVKPHQCQQCLKSFSSNHQLVQHIRVHTGEKPYKCSYCDRRFKQLSHVQQHTRLHTAVTENIVRKPACLRVLHNVLKGVWSLPSRNWLALEDYDLNSTHSIVVDDKRTLG
ncbi:jg22707 [Pararge aegeria aegeria]|uniref:Jg22707 protein n=1 Tax=Pararge aegeria aegeria TaxID=348720 RepID=A0A8S4RQR1_9NEOP|nr:jg22707 [Pararge aegeria aegeria]